jgi:hypothetical protein
MYEIGIKKSMNWMYEIGIKKFMNWMYTIGKKNSKIGHMESKENKSRE